MSNDETGLEVEVATVKEFLRLLKEREGGASPQGPRGAIRRAVFVAQMLEQRSSNYSFPLVRRYVTCGFAYGRDVSPTERPPRTRWSCPRWRAGSKRGSRRPTRKFGRR